MKTSILLICSVFLLAGCQTKPPAKAASPFNNYVAEGESIIGSAKTLFGHGGSSGSDGSTGGDSSSNNDVADTGDEGNGEDEEA